VNWVGRSSVKVGDSVCYSAVFLRSINSHFGDLPWGRGVVTGLKTLGADVVLAEIAWNLPDLPGRVNVRKLSRITPKGILE
jgi:hypothetical protein